MAGITNNQLSPVDLSEVAYKCKNVPVEGELVKIAETWASVLEINEY